MEYYTATKRNDFHLHLKRRLTFINVMLSARIQSHKGTYHMILFVLSGQTNLTFLKVRIVVTSWGSYWKGAQVGRKHYSSIKRRVCCLFFRLDPSWLKG